MNIVVTYDEFSDYIKKKFNLSINFTFIETKKVAISYNPMVLLPSIELELNIIEVSNDKISISYNCGGATSFVISSAVSFLQNKIPNGIEVDTKTQLVSIRPRHIEQAKDALEYIEMSDIKFEKDLLKVSFSLV